MDILLTGASGFIGRHLVAALAREHRIIPMARRPAGAADEIIHDFTRPLSNAALPQRVDAVIHAAGLVGKEANLSPLCHRVNVEATQELADYAVKAGAKRFVLFSTGGVYRASDQVLTERAPVEPTDAYSKSKRRAEEIVRGIQGPLEVQIFRPFFPFGPTQQQRLIPSLIHKVQCGLPISLSTAAGHPLLTPIFIDDLVEYVRRALLLPRSFVANLAGSETPSIRALAELIGQSLKRSPSYEIKEELSPNWRGANDFISQTTDYAPMVSMVHGLRRTIGGMADEVGDRSFTLPQES